MKYPQEIEVWYLLPAIRRELTLDLIKEKLSQKEVAKILGVTEPAISQYLNAKRAKEIRFNKEFKNKIKNLAKKSIKNRKVLMNEIKKICDDFKGKGLMCKLHRKYGVKNCRICLK